MISELIKEPEVLAEHADADMPQAYSGSSRHNGRDEQAVLTEKCMTKDALRHYGKIYWIFGKKPRNAHDGSEESAFCR